MDLNTATRILGIDRNTSVDDAKKAYRKIAKRTHPDAVGVGRSDEFSLATEAVECFERWHKSGRPGPIHRDRRPPPPRYQDPRYGAHNTWGDTRQARWREAGWQPDEDTEKEDEEQAWSDDNDDIVIGHGTAFTILALRLDGVDVPNMEKCRASLVINRSNHPKDAPCWRIYVAFPSPWTGSASSIEFMGCIPDRPDMTVHYVRPIVGRSYGRNGIEIVEFEPIK